MPQTDSAMFYQLYFQNPGVAEAELEKDVRHSLRTTLFGGATSPEGDATSVGMIPRVGGWLAARTPPAVPPSWITEADIDFYEGEFRKSGFRGGLNWYRNIDRNWELLAPWSGAKVNVPALYIAGERDLVSPFSRDGQVDTKLESVCSATSRHINPSRMWSLDSAGTAPGGEQRRD